MKGTKFQIPEKIPWIEYENAWETVISHIFKSICTAVQQKGNRSLEEISSVLYSWQIQFIYDQRIPKAPYLPIQFDKIKHFLSLAKKFKKENTITPTSNWEKIIYDIFAEKQKNTIAKKQIITILLNQKQPVLAKLTLALVEDGCGTISNCATTHPFIVVEENFQKSIAIVKNFLIKQNVWPNHCDIIWKLEREDSKPIHYIEGESMGAAFALAAWELLKKQVCCKSEQTLHSFIDRVSATASIDCEGNLHPILGVWEKFEGNYLNWGRKGLLRLIIVAPSQLGIGCSYFEPPARPQAIKAKNIKEASKVICNKIQYFDKLADMLNIDREILFNADHEMICLFIENYMKFLKETDKELYQCVIKKINKT